MRLLDTQYYLNENELIYSQFQYITIIDLIYLNMSTIILLDVSLSMCRPAGPPSELLETTEPNVVGSKSNTTEIKQLANVGIGTLLDYFAQNAQLERTALVVFSSLWEIKHEFTRHHESIKDAIYDLELYDKSNVVNAIRGILQLKTSELAQSEVVNIILITDGQLHYEHFNETNDMEDDDDNDDNSEEPRDDFHDIPLTELEGQFDFPCKIQVICLTNQMEPTWKHSIKFYKQLAGIIDRDTGPDCPVLTCNSNARNYAQSAIWLPNCESSSCISTESVEKLFTLIAEVHYKPHRATLACGHLCSMVLLSPKPKDYILKPLKNEFDDLQDHHNEIDSKETSSSATSQGLTRTKEETFVDTNNKPKVFRLSSEINICGFLPISEVASPAVTSRHLVMPIANERFNELSKAEQILTQDPNVHNNTSTNTNMNINNNLLSHTFSEPNEGGATTLQMDNLKAQITLDKQIGIVINNPNTPGSDPASPTKSQQQPQPQASKSVGARASSSNHHSSTNQQESPVGKTTATSESTSGRSSNEQLDITKQPSFCALLHNALKQENMVAICEVGRDIGVSENDSSHNNRSKVAGFINGTMVDESTTFWYGILHAQVDNKKRSSLMLSLLIPSDKPILWLPNFKTMGTSLLNGDLPQAIRDKMNAASNGSGRKQLKSYSSNNVIWLDPESVQADIHKVVRHARRPIDKVAYFYKELNRIRRAAISYGFYDVLFCLANVLEREKNVILFEQVTKQPNASNRVDEMIAHIEHAISVLRLPLDQNSFNTNIKQPNIPTKITISTTAASLTD